MILNSAEELMFDHSLFDIWIVIKSKYLRCNLKFGIVINEFSLFNITCTENIQ